jgi:hypothetical protein
LKNAIRDYQLVFARPDEGMQSMLGELAAQQRITGHVTCPTFSDQ